MAHEEPWGGRGVVRWEADPTGLGDSLVVVLRGSEDKRVPPQCLAYASGDGWTAVGDHRLKQENRSSNSAERQRRDELGGFVQTRHLSKLQFLRLSNGIQTLCLDGTFDSASVH